MRKKKSYLQPEFGGCQILAMDLKRVYGSLYPEDVEGNFGLGASFCMPQCKDR